MARTELVGQLTNDVKVLLDMENTTLYDSKLALLIQGAIVSLKEEGIEEIEVDSINYFNYAILISYKVSLQIDVDVNVNNLKTLYMTTVNEMR